jgi:hypothetical protein
LWKRAPAFRRVVYLAGVASLAGVIAFSLNQTKTAPEPHQVTTIASTVARASNRGEPIKAVAQTGAAVTEHVSDGEAAAIQKPVVDRSEVALDAVAQESARLARCHPHLIPGSAPMPQIDVSKMPDPSIGHIKVHFWVDGRGAVTREVLTGTSYATPAELQAELGFTKTLTFKVPDTVECRTREMELVGDYFEMKGTSGNWATFVKLYPRLSFDSDGVVQSRD